MSVLPTNTVKEWSIPPLIPFKAFEHFASSLKTNFNFYNGYICESGLSKAPEFLSTETKTIIYIYSGSTLPFLTCRNDRIYKIDIYLVFSRYRNTNLGRYFVDCRYKTRKSLPLCRIVWDLHTNMVYDRLNIISPRIRSMKIHNMLNDLHTRFKKFTCVYGQGKYTFINKTMTVIQIEEMLKMLELVTIPEHKFEYTVDSSTDLCIQILLKVGNTLYKFPIYNEGYICNFYMERYNKGLVPEYIHTIFVNILHEVSKLP